MSNEPHLTLYFPYLPTQSRFYIPRRYETHWYAFNCNLVRLRFSWSPLTSRWSGLVVLNSFLIIVSHSVTISNRNELPFTGGLSWSGFIKRLQVDTWWTKLIDSLLAMFLSPSASASIVTRPMHWYVKKGRAKNQITCTTEDTDVQSCSKFNVSIANPWWVDSTLDCLLSLRYPSHRLGAIGSLRADGL